MWDRNHWRKQLEQVLKPDRKDELDTLAEDIAFVLSKSRDPLLEERTRERKQRLRELWNMDEDWLEAWFTLFATLQQAAQDEALIDWLYDGAVLPPIQLKFSALSPQTPQTLKRAA